MNGKLGTAVAVGTLVIVGLNLYVSVRMALGLQEVKDGATSLAESPIGRFLVKVTGQGRNA